MAPFINIVKDPVKLKSLYCKCWSDFEVSIRVVAVICHQMKLVIAMECHDCVKNFAVNQWDANNIRCGRHEMLIVCYWNSVQKLIFFSEEKVLKI